MCVLILIYIFALVKTILFGLFSFVYVHFINETKTENISLAILQMFVIY